jgi:ribosomal protein L11
MRKLLVLALVGSIALIPAQAATASNPSHASVGAHSVKAGQFCKKADIGKKKTADNGAKVKCKMDGSRARWKNI